MPLALLSYTVIELDSQVKKANATSAATKETARCHLDTSTREAL